jgi:hypothetical protein
VVLLGWHVKGKEQRSQGYLKEQCKAGNLHIFLDKENVLVLHQKLKNNSHDKYI